MGVPAAESAGMACALRSGAGGMPGAGGLYVCSRLAAEVKAAEAIAVAVRSVEVVMAAKGAAVTVAAKEEVAREEAAVAEETVSGTCVVRQGASRRP